MFLNAKKTKVMKVLRQAAEGEKHQNIWINGKKIENIKQFTYLGEVLFNSYDDTPEIKKKNCHCKECSGFLNKNLEGQRNTLDHKKETAIFSIFLYCIIWLGMLGIRVLHLKYDNDIMKKEGKRLKT